MRTGPAKFVWDDASIGEGTSARINAAVYHPKPENWSENTKKFSQKISLLNFFEFL